MRPSEWEWKRSVTYGQHLNLHTQTAFVDHKKAFDTVFRNKLASNE